jgi:hypothetical protein
MYKNPDGLPEIISAVELSIAFSNLKTKDQYKATITYWKTYH